MAPNSGITCEQCGNSIEDTGHRLCPYCETFYMQNVQATNAGYAEKPVNAYVEMSVGQLFKSLDANTTELGNTLAAIRVSQFDDSLEELNGILNEALDERQVINSELGRREKARRIPR